MLEFIGMLEFMGVAVLSAAGWLISLGCPRSAARRHLILCATLAACLLLPAVFKLRAATGWTLLAIPDSGEGGLDDNPLPIHQRAADSPDGADGRHLLRSPRRVHAGR